MNSEVDQREEFYRTHYRSIKGQFAWQSLNNGIVIPVIYRNNELFTAYKLLESCIFPWSYSNQLHSDMTKFDFIPKYEMTVLEASLFREINHIHCDSKYNVSFIEKDFIVRANDVRQMLKYLELVYKKLAIGQKFQESHFGLIQFQMNENGDKTIMPYVKRDAEQLIPCDLFKRNELSSRLSVVELTNIELEYMQFLFRVTKIYMKASRQCVLLSEYLRKTNVRYSEYWPHFNSYKHLLINEEYAPPVYSSSHSYQNNLYYPSWDNINHAAAASSNSSANKRTHTRMFTEVNIESIQSNRSQSGENVNLPAKSSNDWSDKRTHAKMIAATNTESTNSNRSSDVSNKLC